MKKLGTRSQSAIKVRDWLVFNRHEVTWTALLGGIALLIGIYTNS